MANSINTNIAAYYAQGNITRASDNSSNSVARLSSGNRIVQAKDDVAALAAGTGLLTRVNVLKRALINTSQGSSLLQVADGALAQVSDILQRQKAIAIQAGAGSMTDTERGFLNQEFSNLSEEIDRLTANTNFNGVTLLDGSVFDKKVVGTADAVATKATGAINLTAAANGKQLVINGATFSTTSINVATPTAIFLNATTPATPTISEELNALANFLNGSTDTRVSQATYAVSGNSLQITAKNGGTMGETFKFDLGTVSGANTASGTAITASGLVYSLQGASDVGIAVGRTIGMGTVGDTLVTAQSQVSANNTVGMPVITTANLNTSLNAKTITINTGAANLVFTFNNVNSGVQDMVIGATLEETLDNAVAKLNNFKNTATATDIQNYALNQLEFRRDGRNIIAERRDVGNATGASAAGIPAAITILTNVTGGTPTAATNFNNGSTGGITTSGVANKDFLGTISGFEATFTGVTNRADISVTVGDYTYQAQGVNTSVTANTTVRFSSVGGGYFDVELAANTGTAVTDQSGATTFAARLDAAFSGLSFFQDRNVDSYIGAGDILTNSVVTGSLTGTSVQLQGEDFSDVAITDIRITSPLSGNANGVIEFDINGETYRSAGLISDRLGAYSVTQFQSLSNANHVLEFRNGATTTFFRNSQEAESLESSLKKAFGFDSGGASLNFQVGSTTSDNLKVSISSVTTAKIFGGETLDVTTQASAAHASDVLDDAIAVVTSARAEVGALQSRFAYATNNIESSIQNQDAARGVLLDTDIAKESTAYATSQVQLQAGIAVLAQANLLPQNLLKLIG